MKGEAKTPFGSALDFEHFLKEPEAKLICQEETTMWTRGASNAGYHYFGCARTLALVGKGFADAKLQMLESESRK